MKIQQSICTTFSAISQDFDSHLWLMGPAWPTLSKFLFSDKRKTVELALR